ncbi:MAG: phage tail tape measure protein [Anaerolineae bacterium]|nr:phage tail tape measure protein [Anaerolineae bacterium]
MADRTTRLILKGEDQASSVFDTVGGSVGGLAGVMGGVLVAGAAAAAGAVTAVGAGVAYSVGRAAEFEQAMANVGAISLASAEDLDRLKNAALEAGSTTAFTATQAADGLAFLAMAGFDVEQSIAALPAVLSAAAAGNMDLATTADIVSNVLGGFRLDAEEAGRVADVLALASANSNTSIEMLGQTMKFAAPTAANLGWSLEEVTAAAGFLADAGIQSSLAGTHLRAVMGSLATPTSIAADALEEMGIAVRDAEGNMLPLPNIIGQFEGALAALGPEQRDFALNAIFGREAAGSFSILLGRGSEALGEYADKLEGAGGAAEEMANRQLDTLQGSMTLLKSAIDGVAVTVGSAFLPVLTDLARAAIPFVETAMSRLQPYLDALPGILGTATTAVGALFDGLSSGQGIAQSITTALAGLVPAGVVEQLAPILTWIENFIGAAISFVQEHSEEIKGALIAIGAVLAAAGIASTIAAVVAAVGALANPVGLVIAAVGLLGAAWAGNWGDIQGKTQAAIDFIQPLIQNALDNIQTWWAANGDAVIASAINTYETVRAGIETAIQTVQTIISTVLTGIQTFWTAHGDSITTIARFIYETVKTGIETAITAVKTVVETVLTGLQVFWDAHGAAILESAQIAWDAIQIAIETVTDVIGSILDAFASAIEGDWYAFGENLREAWDTLWSGISNALLTWEAAIQNTVESIANGIIDWFTNTDWPGVGRDIITGIASGISSATQFIMDAARAAAQAAIDAARGLLDARSPSVVAAQQVGRPFSQGIAMGAVDELDNTADQIRAGMDRKLMPRLQPISISRPTIMGIGDVNRIPGGANGQRPIIIEQINIYDRAGAEMLLAYLQGNVDERALTAF